MDNLIQQYIHRPDTNPGNKKNHKKNLLSPEDDHWFWNACRGKSCEIKKLKYCI